MTQLFGGGHENKSTSAAPPHRLHQAHLEMKARIEVYRSRKRRTPQGATEATHLKRRCKEVVTRTTKRPRRHQPLTTFKALAGLADMGHHYLHLHRPSLTSYLVLRHSERNELGVKTMCFFYSALMSTPSDGSFLFAVQNCNLEDLKYACWFNPTLHSRPSIPECPRMTYA